MLIHSVSAVYAVSNVDNVMISDPTDVRIGMVGIALDGDISIESSCPVACRMVLEI